MEQAEPINSLMEKIVNLCKRRGVIFQSADIYGDLADFKQLPANLFDCFICTQVLNFIFDFSMTPRKRRAVK